MKYSIVKRIMMVSLAGSICIGAAFAAYAAPSGQGRRGRMEQETGSDGSDNTGGGFMGERPELPDGMAEGERPELPEGMEEGERPELPEGMEEGERPELPEGMEEGERPELPEGMKAGKRSGISGNSCKEGFKHGGKAGVNIMAYKDALEGIEDEETKASLQGYIDALDNALKAAREARDSNTGLTEDELSSYSKAVSDAADELKSEFEKAGIEVAQDMRGHGRRDGMKGERPEAVSGNRPAAGEDREAASGSNERSQEDAEGDRITKKKDNKAGSDAAESEVSSNSAESRKSGRTSASDDENNTWKRIKGWFARFF